MVSCRSLTHYVLTPPILALIVVVQVIITLLLVINSYSLNKAAYKEQIDASTLGQTHSSHLRNTVVVYNRIPKTGSTSLMQLPYELCYRNKYNVLLLNLTGGPRSYTMNLKDRMAFAWNITGWKEKQPAIYHGHFAFMDITSMPINHQTNVLHINMIRKPMDRLVSYYYFLRYGDEFRPNKIRSRMGTEKVTFDECVERNFRERQSREQSGSSNNKCVGGENTCDCDSSRLWLQVPWFCGHFQRCWSPPGNTWALQQAKHNLISKHLLVGLTEDIDSFVEMLELILPQFFKGANELFHNADRNLNHVRKTKHKDPISDLSIARLEGSKIWKVENEFYEFAEAQFKAAKAALMASNKGLSLQHFHYDKIRPKY